MGFDSHILIDETHPTWEFTSGYVDWLERWKQPHNPKLWLANSCVWYSQVMEKLGKRNSLSTQNVFNMATRRFRR